MNHRATAKRSVRSTILGVISTSLLAAASVFGFASAAQADWVSPEGLDLDGPWYAIEGWDESADENIPYMFTECAIQLPFAAGVQYYPSEEEWWSFAQYEDFIASLAVNVSDGQGEFWVMFDRRDSGSSTADIRVLISAGVHGIDPSDTIELEGSTDLGIGETPTLQELLDALEATGDEFLLYGVTFYGNPDAELRWIEFGGETYWFGTDATWFTDDPTCGAAVPAPTKPDAVQTAVK